MTFVTSDDSDRDFPDDVGQHPNKCHDCGEWFVGNARRLCCALCNPEFPEVKTEDGQIELPLEIAK